MTKKWYTLSLDENDKYVNVEKETNEKMLKEYNSRLNQFNLEIYCYHEYYDNNIYFSLSKKELLKLSKIIQNKGIDELLEEQEEIINNINKINRIKDELNKGI